MLDDNGKKI